jgi:hypothetical protein
MPPYVFTRTPLERSLRRSVVAMQAARYRSRRKVWRDHEHGTYERRAIRHGY